MIYHYNIIYSLNDFAHIISNIIYYFKKLFDRINSDPVKLEI